MMKWQYKVLEYAAKSRAFKRINIDEDYETELNRLGSEGWELIKVIPLTEQYGRLGSVHLILKRCYERDNT